MHLIPAAIALLAWAAARPHVVQAQEVNWRGPMEGDITTVLRGYYIRVMSPSTLRPGCRADEGELCFGGDPEDQGCRSERCRDPEDIDRFLTGLAEAATAQPGDALAIGQAVYAYARLADFGEALALAQDCAVASWWCELLLGMVHDRAGRPSEADSRFRSALLGADTAFASRLMGIGELLGDADRPEYQRTCRLLGGLRCRCGLATARLALRRGGQTGIAHPDAPRAPAPVGPADTCGDLDADCNYGDRNDGPRCGHCRPQCRRLHTQDRSRRAGRIGGEERAALPGETLTLTPGPGARPSAADDRVHRPACTATGPSAPTRWWSPFPSAAGSPSTPPRAASGSCAAAVNAGT